MKIIAIVVLLSLGDFGTTVLCTRWLGATLTYSLFAVPMLVGLFLQWRRWKVIDLDFKPGQSESADEHWQAIPDRVARLNTWILTTILLLIPGLVTASFAFALMLPPFHKAIYQWFFDFMTPIVEARNEAVKATKAKEVQVVQELPEAAEEQNQ